MSIHPYISELKLIYNLVSSEKIYSLDEHINNVILIRTLPRITRAYFLKLFVVNFFILVDYNS